MEPQIVVYALVAAATTVVAGIAARTLRAETRAARMQTLASVFIGVCLVQTLVIAGLRPELTGAFVIAAFIAVAWTFMRRMVIRPRA